MKTGIEIDNLFRLAYRFVTETNENIFLTGKAGTGKTTFLRYLKENCTKNIVVTAPTGVASINAGGVTLHSLFRLPLHPLIPSEYGRSDLLQKLRYRKNKLQLLRKMDLLVIDEISMVRADVLDAIDTILKSVRRTPNQPFGGVQVLLIGDLYQLPPVARNEEWSLLSEYYNSEFFFDSQVIRNDMPVIIELKKVFRQQEGDFLTLLNKVRNNQLENDDFELLNERYLPFFVPGYDEQYITLTSHNVQADRKNQSELANLPGRKFVYKAEIDGIFPENAFPADPLLELKEGAQVMFLKNDIEKRYYNGKIGTVKYLDEKKITVMCDEEEIEVPTESWDNSRYSVDGREGKLQQEVLGTFKQYPLRLAWAVTIHKSQGLTFDKVMIEAASAFSSGQVYVALSRCTSMEGIVLLSKIPARAILCNDAVVAYSQNSISDSSLASRFDGARQAFTRQLFEEIFSFDSLHRNIDLLEAKTIQFSARLNEEAFAWVQDFKNKFSRARVTGLKFLNQINSYLKEEPVIEQNEQLQKRISSAADYFLPAFSRLKSDLNRHSLITEHRDAADQIDPVLTEIYQLIDLQEFIFRYCKNPFSLTDFLKYKLNYTVPRKRLYSYASKRSSQTAGVSNRDIFNSLKEWRNRICDDNDIPIYMVANQNSLSEIAKYLPLTKRDLQKIKGFGRIKAEKYGDDILDIVKEYCDRMNIQTRIDQLEISEKPAKREAERDKTPSATISYNMFKEGKTVDEIAKERGYTPGTIEGHLSQFVKDNSIDLNELVKPENQALIREAASEHGWESLKVLKDNLPEEITYGQIRLTKTALQ